MTRPHRPAIALTVAIAALAAPNVAFAHAGKTPPVEETRPAGCGIQYKKS